MDDVFKALSDPSRRELLDSLNAQNGQTLRELSAGLDMARQSVSKHLGILEAANLVTTLWRGREKLHYLNADPINAISERWINQYDRQRIGAIADLKKALETTTMSDTEFVYTTYIEAPPELVWRGLTDPTFTRRYWGMEFTSDWKVGSTISVLHNRTGVVVADAEMVVRESDPYTRLSFGWEAHPAEQYGEEHAAKAGTEPRSTVTYELEPQGTQTKLTVMHTGFEPGSVVLPDIRDGWPKVVSWLKTFLESGKWEEAA
ncbi:MAG TPA: SRPBCC domain-containing protein [Galbitalea sp.]|jgi:uncharacterized protein YndB with AHSA1/START domain|nr:SRPBCC domain-containing protein [Galbitalea sp.]